MSHKYMKNLLRFQIGRLDKSESDQSDIQIRRRNCHYLDTDLHFRRQQKSRLYFLLNSFLCFLCRTEDPKNSFLNIKELMAFDSTVNVFNSYHIRY